MDSRLITINHTGYTQVIVGDNDFFQNPNDSIVYGIMADVQPAHTAAPHFKFEQSQGANGLHHKGTWWLKASSIKDNTIAFGTKSV